MKKIGLFISNVLFFISVSLSGAIILFYIGYISNTIYKDYENKEARIKAWSDYSSIISDDAFNGMVLSGKSEVLSKLNQIESK